MLFTFLDGTGEEVERFSYGAFRKRFNEIAVQRSRHEVLVKPAQKAGTIVEVLRQPLQPRL